MSLGDRLGDLTPSETSNTSDVLDSLDSLDAHIDRAVRRAFIVVFGDRIGASVFLAALLFFALYWRVELLSTDNYMHMNTLLSASDGGFAIDRFVYGPASGETPGVHYFDGRVYGDNYGLILSSLPAFYLFELFSLITDLHVVLAGLWSLGVLGLTVVVRSTLDTPTRRARLTVAGVLVALGAFAANVALATPLSPRWTPLIALQSTSMLAAALVAVTLYRLASLQYGTRVGVAAAVVTFLASPLGFWAVVPKRHSLSALFAVATLYAFYRSRHAPTLRDETLFRAVAYGVIGLCTWVHAAEALILLAALVPVDFATARTNRPRSLAIVALVFGVSLLPFALTNYAITGNPAQPLRLLTDYSGQPLVADAQPTPADTAAATGAGDAAAAQSPGATGHSSTTSTGFVAVLVGTLAAVGGKLTSLVGSTTMAVGESAGYLVRRLSVSLRLLTEADRLADVFLRSGYQSHRAGQDRAVNLTVLESMPLLGAAFALPVLFVRSVRPRLRGPHRTRLRSLPRSLRSLSPLRTIDLFVALYSFVLVVFFLRSLPLHHMLTVRYLHPLYVVGVYALVRLSVVRTVIRTQWSTLARVYGLTVLLGVPAYLGSMALLDTVQSEAIQLYALCTFSLGILVGLWSVTSVVVDDDRTVPLGAVLLGVAAGAMTVYLFVSGLVLFSVEGTYALPVARALSDALLGVNPFR